MNVSSDHFARSLVRADGRLLIYSVCLVCGEGQLVSKSDGTLSAWEETHQCSKKPVSLVEDPREKSA